MLSKCPVFLERMLEIMGMSFPAPDNKLEEIFCKIVDKIGVKIKDWDIRSCHRVGRS